MPERHANPSAAGLQSPCVRQCRLMDGACAGCGRTLEEIKLWSEMNDEQRMVVMSRLGACIYERE